MTHENHLRLGGPRLPLADADDERVKGVKRQIVIEWGDDNRIQVRGEYVRLQDDEMFPAVADSKADATAHDEDIAAFHATHEGARALPRSRGLGRDVRAYVRLRRDAGTRHALRGPAQ